MKSGPVSVDVLVVGGGLAALCAAIAARRLGASVWLAEAAPKVLRGGNMRHSRNLRLAHDSASPWLPGNYPAAEFLTDLQRVTQGAADAALMQLLAQESSTVLPWLQAQGVVFQNQHLTFSRKTAFFLGGGKMALHALYATAQRLGVEMAFDCAIPNWPAPGIKARAGVICSGTAQATMTDNFINRGSPFADGKLLDCLLAQGVASVGTKGAAHLVAVDARFTDPDGGIVTRIDGMALGMVVDQTGRRFQDELAITGPGRYSSWGHLIAARPKRWAALVLDAQGLPQAPPMALAPMQADSLAQLAQLLNLPAPALLHSAAQTQRIGTPPFFAFPMRPGVAFTCHGVKVGTRAQLLKTDGSTVPALFAAGAIMAPNVLGCSYLAGTGLTIAAVFGRLAGQEAARHALD